ncbi:MAG: hypothetical protein GX496_05575 [Firmicutes bacterium]|nr:hypothetical protein [Bacillota bacterium]
MSVTCWLTAVAGGVAVTPSIGMAGGRMDRVTMSPISVARCKASRPPS